MRRRDLVAAALLTALPRPLLARLEPAQLLDLALATVTDNRERRRQSLRQLIDHGAPDVAAVLIDLLLYYSDDVDLMLDGLQRLTGERRAGWFDWMLWQEAQSQLRPFAGYDRFKAHLLAAIDAEFLTLLRPGLRSEIRLEEVVWGGVFKDGIPALVNPSFTAADQAGWLLDNELVFGIAINGDVRAYPHRIMDWHEMANDTVGGVALALAYCTLCGAGVLYETHVAGRQQPFEFGSSGLLYRSNKLMYDRETSTLWNHMTGRPVIGELAGSALQLVPRPLTVTRWGLWRQRHPGTRILSLDTGHRRPYEPGRPYGDYFASPELMFPARGGSPALPVKEILFALRGDGLAVAWPLRWFADRPVINDRIDGRDIVLIGSALTETVRAYAGNGRRFVAGSSAGQLSDGASHWQITEAHLESESGARLPRLAGHNVYAFAWSNFMGGRLGTPP